ncbi:MAG TPA: hypothetical protein VJ957_00650, partial [Longimicrobiales bacterium]|nr:hypothetical protein [Longimicrobiales bacterium]
NRRTPDGLSRAIEGFRTAVLLDSTFARAYAGIATAHMLAVTYAYPGTDAYTRSRQAMAAADRAITLDSTVAEAFAARGYVRRYLWTSGNAARLDLERAIALEPQYADAHGWYGHLLARDGDYSSAMAEHERAVTLDPLSPGRHTGFAFDALLANRPELALREAQRALALEAGLADPRAAEALAYLLMNGYDEGLALDLGPYQAVHALCLHSAGREEEGAALADSVARAIGGSTGLDAVLPLTSLALYYGWTGDAHRALDHLAAANALSPDTHVLRLIGSPFYVGVASNPQFKAGVARMRHDIWRRAALP